MTGLRAMLPLSSCLNAGLKPRAPKLKGYNIFPVAVVCIAQPGKAVKGGACATACGGEALDSLSRLCLL